ncbi:helix-turn-helix domain-containing protein [Frankia sp. AiPa1]|uniref:helix-turn-helix domain-containing protein n=1 Tax=Frankia sp. AiPa1 TaxID=573492 RepID=UPI00202ACA2E|nr:helix-turn-helix domain-containing protein [Frankia sp. AiPa1]MCL9760204.1 helix-turn-helix domain-containing protein [Frankia sp. AiPa1]
MSRPSPQTERLLNLIDLLASRPSDGLALAEIARAVGVSKATVHPMVVALTRRGWLLRHPELRTYRLGPALVAAGRAAAQGNTALDLARPVARDLAADTGVPCVALVAGGIPGEDDDLLVGEIGLPSAGAARPASVTFGMHTLRLGDRIRPRPPLGAVSVAWADEAAAQAWLARLGPDRPADALARLTPGLAGIRSRGWAVEIEDHLYERLSSLLSELDEDQVSDAAHTAALRRLMADVGRAFNLAGTLPATVDPAAEYRPTSINAPVFDAGGSVVVVLCLIFGLERRRNGPLPGSTVLELGERVRAAADSVTVAAHGRPPGRREPPGTGFA